jgi:putative redox protein
MCSLKEAKMEITVKYAGNQKFIAQSGRYQMVIDQPKEKGGNDEGMNPLEVFLVALGACAGVYAKNYCQNAQIDASGLQISVVSDLSPDAPKRFKDIKVAIDLGGKAGERQNALLNFVKNCPVHNTVSEKPNVEFTVK